MDLNKLKEKIDELCKDTYSNSEVYIKDEDDETVYEIKDVFVNRDGDVIVLT
ncbi:hypothetical protein [Clostridium botulinum]|uniref:hypothetical protein n=1 Tax=Clostridium botulinum TaxID=1491 RepID=UPI001968A2BA|nr:hypothetical protein [Clostridium botulinum]